MKNKDIRKIQFGGWSKRPFSEIRKKVEIMVEQEDQERNRRSLKRKKKCKFNKGEHKFVMVKESKFLEYHWIHYKCELCGKMKFS